eukprot:1138464-Pelagomonas_calceolata.AAC.2
MMTIPQGNSKGRSGTVSSGFVSPAVGASRWRICNQGPGPERAGGVSATRVQVQSEQAVGASATRVQSVVAVSRVCFVCCSGKQLAHRQPGSTVAVAMSRGPSLLLQEAGENQALAPAGIAAGFVIMRGLGHNL